MIYYLGGFYNSHEKTLSHHPLGISMRDRNHLHSLFVPLNLSEPFLQEKSLGSSGTVSGNVR